MFCDSCAFYYFYNYEHFGSHFKNKPKSGGGGHSPEIALTATQINLWSLHKAGIAFPPNFILIVEADDTPHIERFWKFLTHKWDAWAEQSLPKHIWGSLCRWRENISFHSRQEVELDMGWNLQNLNFRLALKEEGPVQL